MKSNNVFAERLRQAMKDNNMKIIDLERKTGLMSPAISNWRNGQYKPNGENMAILAKALNVSVDWLSGTSDRRQSGNVIPLMVNKMRLINVYTHVSCGKGLFNDNYVSDTISLPSELFIDGRVYFATYAQGDSMVNAGINDGDLLIFEKTDTPQENKIGTFCLGDIALCKKYHVHDGKVYLLSANELYAPIVVEPTDNFRTVGVLAFVLNKR